MKAPSEDRVVGALVGLALGDALGAPVEWLDCEEIAQRFPDGVRDFVADPSRRIAAGQVTDDTEMAFVTAESLVAGRGLDMGDLSARFVSWGESRTDLGGTTAAGIAALRAGVHWSISGAAKDPSSGCLPRCAPIALAVPPAEVVVAAIDCCRATHWHPLAVAAVVAQNLLVARLVRGEPWTNAVAAVRVATPPAGMDQAWRAILAAWLPGAGAANGAPAVLAEALRCVDESPGAEAAMVAAVSLGGDTDTRGAVAGFLAGARWGLAALPGRWLRSCPAASEAQRLGLALATFTATPTTSRKPTKIS